MQGKIKERLLKYNTPRRIVQFLSFMFLSSIVFNLGSLPLLLPVLWTWGLNQNTAGDAFTGIQMFLGGWPNVSVVFPWLAVAAFLITGILIGKSMCGWVCPFGFVQDLVGFIKRKQPDVSAETHGTLLWIKYGILGIALFVSASYSVAKLANASQGYETALGVFAKAPFTTVSPAETLFAAIPRGILNFQNAILEKPLADVLSSIVNIPVLFWLQFAILVGVLVFAAFIPRSWCRYFCPHGAIMAVLNRFSFIGLRRDLTRCKKDECRQCVMVCPTRVKILDLPWEKFSDPECIYCMKCADACADGALKLTYP